MNQGIYSALACLMLNVVTNEYVQSVCKTKHSKLKESPEATHTCGTNQWIPLDS